MNKNIQTSTIVFLITLFMMFLHEKFISKREFNLNTFLKDNGFISLISAILFYVVQDFMNKAPSNEILLHTSSYDN